MAVVAVLDCGTGSIRAVVAEVKSSTEVVVLDTFSREVDLRSVFQRGGFGRREMDQIIATVQDIDTALHAYEPEMIRAVATSAWRSASNAEIVIERLRQECSFTVEVIDGGEEARLYYEAFNRLLASEQVSALQGDAIMADLGSGGTMISLISGGKLVQSFEEHFGVLRLINDFKNLKDSIDFLQALDRYAHGAATMMITRLQRRRVKHLIVTGDEIRRLVRILNPDAQGRIPEMHVSALRGWYERCQERSLVSLTEDLSLTLDEVVATLIGASLVCYLCESLDADKVRVPQLSLRDGLIADFMPDAQGPHHLNRTHLLAAARQLARKFHSNIPYAKNTAVLAGQLFDQTKELHRLAKRERALLEFAAWVHDIGSYINVRSRHKHTYYIMKSVDVAGLTELEREVVAQVARYHRRSVPHEGHSEFTALPQRERVVVRYLAALLRIAYALDVERKQRITSLHCQFTAGALILRVERRQVTLERWSLQRRSGLFSEVFGLDVKILPMEA